MWRGEIIGTPNPNPSALFKKTSAKKKANRWRRFRSAALCFLSGLLFRIFCQSSINPVDLILRCSRSGIFVVETKNLSGWIFGGGKQATWTQKLYRRTFKFQNLLRQNFRHIKALDDVLNLSGEKFHSVVVFTGGGTFKTPMPPNVTSIGGFLGYIKSKKQVILSHPEIEGIVHKIGAGRPKPSFATAREHIRHIESKRNAEGPSLSSPKPN